MMCRIKDMTAIAKLYLALTFVFTSTRVSIGSYLNASVVGSGQTLRSLEDLEICVELATECHIQGDLPGSTIRCEEFRSQPLVGQSPCKRFAVLKGNITNIFNTSIAISHQIDGGSAKTVLKAPAEIESIGPAQKIVDLCDIGNAVQLPIFSVQITAGYRIGQSPLKKCRDTKKVINLELPTRSPTQSPVPSLSPSNSRNPTMIPSINDGDGQPPTKTPTRSPSSRPTSEPSLMTSSTPSQSPTRVPSRRSTSKPSLMISSTPSQSPTRSPSNGPSLKSTTIPSVNDGDRQPQTRSPSTSRPTSKPSSMPTTIMPTLITSPSSSPTLQCKEVGSKGKKNKISKGKEKKSKAPISSIGTGNGKGKGKTVTTQGPNVSVHKTTKTKSPTIKKRRLQSKRKGKTKTPTTSVGKGKGGKGKKKKCRSVATDCSDLSDVPITVPVVSEQTTLHYGVEIFSDDTIPPSTSEMILTEVNNFFKAGLVGCNTKLQESLDTASIVAIQFKTLVIADAKSQFEGLEKMCTSKPEGFEESVCNRASGSIELFLLSERRRLGLSDEVELSTTLEVILNLYADSVSGDSDIVVGFHYAELSREAYAMSPLDNEGYESGGGIKVWMFPMFLALVLTILFMTIFVLRKNGRRLRRATEVQYEEDNVSRDLTLFLPDLKSNTKDEKSDVNVHFPIISMEDTDATITADAICMQPLAYDFNQIDLPLMTVEEEEVIQRRQLMREYTIPTIVKDLGDDREDDEIRSLGAEL